MEREQIIKALECCSKDDCDNCPNTFGNCYSNLSGYALSLINELTKEAENYKAIAEKQQSISMDRHFEIKRLKEENERLKADTAKYLIDRIKGYYEVHKGRIRTASLIYYIEQIAKEMLEVKDE